MRAFAQEAEVLLKVGPIGFAGVLSSVGVRCYCFGRAASVIGGYVFCEDLACLPPFERAVSCAIR